MYTGTLYSMAAITTNRRPGAFYGVTQTTLVLPTSNVQEGTIYAHRNMIHRTEERALNIRQMINCHRALAHRDVMSCQAEITKRLFAGNGIVVLVNEEIVKPTLLFETFIQRDMVQFSREAQDAISAMGVVPIAFDHPATAGLGPDRKVAYVPKFGTYVITTWAENGRQKFRFYWNSLCLDEHYITSLQDAVDPAFGEPDDSVIVVANFGANPDLNGNLRSSMASIIDILRFQEKLTNLALVAELIATNPPTLTEYNSSLDDESRKIFQDNFFVGNQEACNDREQFMYNRDSAQHAVYREQLRTYERINGFNAAAEYGSSVSGDTVQTTASSCSINYIPKADAKITTNVLDGYTPSLNVCNIDPTRKIVNTNLPRARSDLTAIAQHTRSVVCSVVLGMMHSDTGGKTRISASVEASSETLLRTVATWADWLSRLMTLIYNELFGLSDIRDELGLVYKQKRKSVLDTPNHILTPDDIKEVLKRTKTRFAFDLQPLTTRDSLWDLYTCKIISYETFAASLLRLNNFAHTQLFNKDDPLTDEEKKEIMLKEVKRGANTSASTKRKDTDGESQQVAVARKRIKTGRIKTKQKQAAAKEKKETE